MASLTSESGIEVEAVPHGPDATELGRAAGALLGHDMLTALTVGTDHRLLSIVTEEDEAKTSAVPEPSDRYRAVLYDYTNNRSIHVRGRLGDLSPAEVTHAATQPPVSREEFEAACDILRSSSELAEPLRRGELRLYRPMPPLAPQEQPDGQMRRAVAVGLETLAPATGADRHRSVAVDMTDRTVVFDPPGLFTSCAQQCGSPAGACTYNAGAGGKVRLTVTQGGTHLWDLVVVRPASSSGTNGSGIELRYVNYRGTRVLYAAHLPILNVQYESPQCNCGPTYRDQNNEESCFGATGSDVIPGFRLCSAPASTILDSGADGGNFQGVAIWVEGTEVVLASVTSAGWYRYVSQWRLAADGVIRPRYGFAATSNACTCLIHHHHAYWRLDFDIQTPADNRVQEYNDPPIVGSAHYHTKRYEVRRSRDAGRKRHWRVMHEDTQAGYSIMPGPNDGTLDAAYGVGDAWVLRYHPSETDDGVMHYQTNPTLSMAHLDTLVNGEAVDEQDVVIWYAGHFRHDATRNPSEMLGPDLVPVNWPDSPQGI